MNETKQGPKGSVIDLRFADISLDSVALPLRLGSDGPVIGRARLVRGDDGGLAVTIDHLDGGTCLTEGLVNTETSGRT